MSHYTSLLTNSPFTVFLAVLLGVLVGRVEVRGFSLGSSGTLFAGLALGFLGFQVDTGYLSLVMFIAAVGLLASTLFIGGGAILAGYAMAVYVWDLSWISTAGAIAGGLTNTPALGAAIATTGSEEVGATFAATYPFALVGMVVFSKLLVLLA